MANFKDQLRRMSPSQLDLALFALRLFAKKAPRDELLERLHLAELEKTRRQQKAQRVSN